MYQTTAEQRTQRLIYTEAYRAIRAYQSGHSLVNPLHALRIMQEIVPWSIPGKTERSILLAQTSFNQRHLAPKGVHECTYKFVPGAAMTWVLKHMQGCSTLRYKENRDNVPAWLHQAKIHASARKVVLGYTHLLNQESKPGFKVQPCTPIERLMLKSDMLRILSNLPLSA